MSETALAWTSEQWDRIRQVVHDEALRARVAASFLPLYGPIPGGAETVPRNALLYPGDLDDESTTLEVNDHDTLRLASVSVNIVLKNHMVADPELTAATMLFRRAAEIVARVEDAVIFNGKAGGAPRAGTKGIPAIYSIGGAETYAGLTDCASAKVNLPSPGPDADGTTVFDAVVEAITRLEEQGYYRPYACVLGHGLFRAVNRPIPASMVLPRDSIPPFLDGPLLRSSCLDDNTGVIVALQGEPVEIVVPSDISVRYLQAMMDGRHVFRVSQRFVLRVKDPRAVARIDVALAGPSKAP